MSASRNRNSGFGSYSYRSAYNHEDHHESIPVSVMDGGSRRVEFRVYSIDSTSATGCSIMARITKVDIKHSSIVVFGVEFEFSQEGVLEKKVPTENKNPSPEEVIDLGRTEKSASELRRKIDDLRRTEYKSSTYNMRSKNCHNFCNDLSLFLTGKPIPNRFLEMADEVTAQATKMALVAGAGALATGILASNLLPRPHQRQVQQNNNSLLMGLGAVAAGGLAYHMLSSNEKPQEDEQRQSSDFGGAGFLGALAAGAAGLAIAFDSSNQQPQQRALGFGARNNNADENGPAEWLERMFNLR